MTQYYLNSISGSDSNVGTSEAQAWASFTKAFQSVTGGDVLWVKGAGATYASVNNINTNYFPRLIVEGYDSVTGDKCIDGTPPKFTTRIFSLGGKVSVSNFSAEVDNSTSVLDVRYGGSEFENITIYDKNVNTTTYNGGIFSMSESNPLKRGIRYIPSDSAVFKIATNGGVINWYTQAFRSYFEGSVFDFSNVESSSGSEEFDVLQQLYTGHRTFSSYGNVFMGNPNETGMRCINFRYQSTSVDFLIENTVFYNFGIGIRFTTDIADQQTLTDTIRSRGSKLLIRNCFFVNCGTGIDFQSGFDFHPDIHNCVFYNCTVGGIVNGNGNDHNSRYVTQNPFDPVNRRLNNYGKSLLNLQYQSGTDTVTSDTRREFYQVPVPTKFARTTDNSISLGTGVVGDTVNVSGKAFQLVQDNPRVWRWT